MDSVGDSGRETGGFDTLHVSLYGEWDETRFDELAVDWNAARESAEQRNEAGSWWESPEGDRWLMHAGGGKFGKADDSTKGMYCRWMADWSGVRIYVVNRREESESQPSVMLQLKSLVLMTRGHKAVWDDCRRMLSACGFRLSRHVLGRVDACVDLPGVQVGEFIDLALADHEVSRAERGTMHVGALVSQRETWERSSGRVKVRMYDKLKESERDPVKRAVLIQKRWGGKLPDAATRVEFQVGRECLKDDFQINTFDDLDAKAPQLLEWLTTEWYRLADRPVDRVNRNQSRVPTAAVWQRVCEAFAWVGRNTIEMVVPRKVLRPKVDQLLKQGLGCFAGAFALCEREFLDAVELVDVGTTLLLMEAERLFERLGAKRDAYRANVGQAVADVGGAPF